MSRFITRLPRAAVALLGVAAALAIAGKTDFAALFALWSLIPFAWWGWNRWGFSRYGRMIGWRVRYGRKLPKPLRLALLDLAFDWRLLGSRAGLAARLRPLGFAGMEIGADELPTLRGVMHQGRNLILTVDMPVGASVSTLRDKADILAASVRAREVLVSSLDHQGQAQILVPTGDDPLMQAPIPVGAIPVQARSGAAIPVALSEDGSPVQIGTAHWLVVGATGSGKGSAWWARVFAQRVRLFEGTLQLIGLDSKSSEVKLAEEMFCETGYTGAEHAAVLARLRRVVEARGKTVGRMFVASKEQPEIVCLIDEFSSFEKIFDDTKSRNQALGDLRFVLSLGRSRGVTVVAMGQDPTKESMALRNLFPEVSALRLRDATETRLVLGDGAVDEGLTPHKIPVASSANAYESAGIGWTRDEFGIAERCRFPFVSDDDIKALTHQASHDGHGCAKDQSQQEAA